MALQLEDVPERDPEAGHEAGRCPEKDECSEQGEAGSLGYDFLKEPPQGLDQVRVSLERRKI